MICFSDIEICVLVIGFFMTTIMLAITQSELSEWNKFADRTIKEFDKQNKEVL